MSTVHHLDSNHCLKVVNVWLGFLFVGGGGWLVLAKGNRRGWLVLAKGNRPVTVLGCQVKF